MTAKKRWLVNCVDLTQRDDCNASHISWSSSSSEKEESRNFKPRKKIEVGSRHKRFTSSKSKHNCNTIETFRSKPAESPDDIKPSRTSNHNFVESPITDRFLVEKTSPILCKIRNVDDQNVSPVINKGQVLKELKRKRNDSEVKHYKCEDRALKQVYFTPFDSPDYSRTQSTLIIDSTSPPENSSSTATSLSNEDKSIEPISSQGSSDIIISSYSTSSMSESKGEPVLYYHIIPKKKRYRKGGLASQLQKALRKQRTSIGIWKHEVYLSKLKNESDLLDSEFVHLSVSKMWSEFGTRVLKCCHVDRDEDYCILVLKDEVRLNVNNEFKLYPPFCTRTINYKGETVNCYYNISKILTCKS